MYRWTYYFTVFIVTLGGSTQFYNYDIVNPEQETLIGWLNTTYYERNNRILDAAQLNFK